jgi:hypothetical protein
LCDITDRLGLGLNADVFEVEILTIRLPLSSYFLHNTQLIMSARAIWYVAGTKRSPNGTLYMHCNVKPGASKNREGIASVDDEAVGICVAAQAREGEANKAVIKVLSEVCFSQYT